MPLVAEALRSGLITRTHVRVFARACSPERAGLFARDEALLVAKTLTLSFRFFARAIAYWIPLANNELGLGEPDPVDKRTASSHDASAGMWATSAMLDALDGAEVDNELRRLERIEFDADWAETRGRLGDAATASDLARTSGQRLADALVEMARRSARTTRAGEPARRVINLRMDYPTFVAELALMTGARAATWPTDRVSENRSRDRACAQPHPLPPSRHRGPTGRVRPQGPHAQLRAPNPPVHRRPTRGNHRTRPGVFPPVLRNRRPEMSGRSQDRTRRRRPHGRTQRPTLVGPHNRHKHIQETRTRRLAGAFLRRFD